MFVALLLRYWWVVAIAGVIAWGGLGWYEKASAEKDLADYQLAAAKVISERLAENQRLTDQQQKAGYEIADAFEKGKKQNAQAMAPALADLDFLRKLYRTRSVSEHPNPDPGTVPGPANPAGQPDATACTDQPGAIVEAAGRVVEDLAACGDTTEQVIRLQAWVMEVCQK